MRTALLCARGLRAALFRAGLLRARVFRATLVCASIVACACGPSRTESTVHGPSTPTAGPRSAPTADAELEARRRHESKGGMWMPEQLRAQADELRRLGLGIDPGSLSDPMAYPLGAVVWLGGCTASFVSPEGLVV